MAWVIVGEATWVRAMRGVLDGARVRPVVGAVDAGHLVEWPADAVDRGAVVCCRCYGFRQRRS